MSMYLPFWNMSQSHHVTSQKVDDTYLRWITIFNFANGFYACEIRLEDQPYICFYIEGRGYYAYMRMPFGLTGAPSTFAGMTAAAIGDLMGTLIELFVVSPGTTLKRC